MMEFFFKKKNSTLPMLFRELKALLSEKLFFTVPLFGYSKKL